MVSQSVLYVLFINICIAVSILLDLIRIIALPIEADLAIDIVIFFFIGVFLLDIWINSIQKKQYSFSFQFFLDLFTTCTLVFDTQILLNLIIYSDRQSKYQASKVISIMDIVRYLRILRIVQVLKRDFMYQIKRDSK